MKTKKEGWNGILILKGLLMASLLTGIGILIGAWVLEQNWIQDGEDTYIGITAAIAAVSLIISGGVVSRAVECKKIFTAFCVGIGYIGIRIIIAYLLMEEWNPTSVWWGQSALQIVAAMIGGCIGKVTK